MSKPSDHRCCTDSRCESGLKNHYYPGKRLTADSFRVEQDYQIERRWLLNRAVHGWGVVNGYGVAASPLSDSHKGPGTGRLRIGPGLALDPCGRELLQVGTRAIALGDVIPIDAVGKELPREKAFRVADDEKTDPARSRPRRCWLLSVHYAEEHHGSVTVSEPCSCERREHDHVCETVRYSLREVPCEECCRDWPCEIECKCGSGDCCGERTVDQHAHHAVAAQSTGTEERAVAPEPERPPKRPLADQPHRPLPPLRRGGCRCLCDSLIALPLGGNCGLCEVEEPCGKVWVDLAHSVPLACVELVSDECDRAAFGGWVEPCGPRRLVKRNDLLFDLIRGCDLTRIDAIGWADWHRRTVSFEDFSQALGGDGVQPGHPEDEYVAEKFSVHFSRPVLRETLLRDCFAMTILIVEREGGWWQPLRVPIKGLKLEPDPGGNPHYAVGATPIVNGGWLAESVLGRYSHFIGSEAQVEIEVRGDFIVDCNGQTVDANAIGLSPSPTGNGKPGDSFLSTFCVAPREAPARDTVYQTASSRRGVSS